MKKEAAKADRIYLATDPDREGEAIAYHLANVLGLDFNSNNRIEFHEITKNKCDILTIMYDSSILLIEFYKNIEEIQKYTKGNHAKYSQFADMCQKI